MAERVSRMVPRAGSRGSFVPLSPALVRTPIAGPYLVSREWARWFQNAWDRQGGAEAPSNAQLESGLLATDDALSETQDDLSQTQDDLSQTQDSLSQTQDGLSHTQNDLTALTARVTTLEADLAALEATVADQATRLAVLEAWYTALRAALPALVTVTTVPTLANDPATAVLLENDLTANWRPPINTNDSDVATAINAVRNALAL